MTESSESSFGRQITTHRIEAFSDGVMAVIITLMAFELKAPAKATFHDLAHEFPALLVYALSFIFIGIYWNNHHHLMRATPRINGAVMWANLHLLFWLSLIPVMTEWIGDSYRYHLPAACYGIVAFGSGIAYTILVRSILRENPDSYVARAIGSDPKGWISIVIYIAAIACSVISPWVSYALYLAVSIIWVIPDRRLVRT